MQPSQILHAIRRNLVACLVILLVCTLAGLGVALSTKPVAAATTTLGIQPKSKETPSFSTQAKDLMPTLVELSTSPKVLDPAAASLNMKTADLSDALTVTNPPETLVLSITAKADSKQKAVDMAKATAASLNRELSSGELLGKQALGMTTSTTSPATPDNTTMERPGARASAASGLLLGILASISYAMFRHRRDSGHSGERSGETGTGRAAAALRALRQRTSDLLRPKPPAQPVPAAPAPATGSGLTQHSLPAVPRVRPGLRRHRFSAGRSSSRSDVALPGPSPVLADSGDQSRVERGIRPRGGLGTRAPGNVVGLGCGRHVPADGGIRGGHAPLRAAGAAADHRSARRLLARILSPSGTARRSGPVPRPAADTGLGVAGLLGALHIVDAVCGPHELGSLSHVDPLGGSAVLGVRGPSPRAQLLHRRHLLSRAPSAERRARSLRINRDRLGGVLA